MEIRVLVTYASKYGATAEIAEKIGQVLRQAGLQADVLPVNRVNDLTPYKAFVLGSAAYMGGLCNPLHLAERRNSETPEPLTSIVKTA